MINISDSEVFDRVQKSVNNLVDNSVTWSVPVSSEEINKVKKGEFKLYLTEYKAIPSDWFPKKMNGLKILCLAGAGGQQAPILAATGADVTVYDLSENMLKQDEFVAKRDGLSLKIEHGNMCDLSRFSYESFDMIINPVSLMYVPDVTPVFCECKRILKKGGTFIMGAPNPSNYLCDYVEEGGYYIACNRLPYKSYEYDNSGDWIEYGHTLESYIGGQIKNGFSIVGFYEDKQQETDEFCDSYFVTRAFKI
jgi:2-polyprenyl-3-methyl-5-hydroxy-6-metoxy-1,4-benzoquinol methylase